MSSKKINTPPIPVFRELMNETNTKREDIAKAIHVSSVAIGQYYNGETLPSIEKLIKIAGYFNVSTDYLLGKTKVNTNNYTLKEVCEYTRLNEDNINYLQRMNEKQMIIINEILYHINHSVPFGCEFINYLYQYSGYRLKLQRKWEDFLSRFCEEQGLNIDELNYIPFDGVCEVLETLPEGFCKIFLEKYNYFKNDYENKIMGYMDEVERKLYSEYRNLISNVDTMLRFNDNLWDEVNIGFDETITGI